MSKPRQVTLAELLQDPIYKQWFQKRPAEREFTKWRVYVKVKRKAPWQKKDFATWVEAYTFVGKHWKQWYDCVLSCRNDPYRPPVVKIEGKRRYYTPMVEMFGHLWCPYCRRPTRFGYFHQHHSFNGTIKPIPYRRRCSVCGIAEEAIRKY